MVENDLIERLNFLNRNFIGIILPVWPVHCERPFFGWSKLISVEGIGETIWPHETVKRALSLNAAKTLDGGVAILRDAWKAIKCTLLAT